MLSNHTEKKWEKKNGSAIYMNLAKPMTYSEFKKFSDDLQKEYIQRLIDRFGCNMSSISELFGVSKGTARNIVDRLSIDRSQFAVGPQSRMSKQQRAAFEAWISGDNAVPLKEPEKTQEVEKDSAEVQLIPVQSTQEEQKPSIMSVRRLDIEFRGRLNVSQITNTILAVASGRDVVVRVIVEEDEKT